MRIEISAGGIGGISVADFQTDMQSYITNAESVISSFKAIQSSTCSLNGGVGSLQGALDEIDLRIASESEAQNQAQHIQSKAADFIQLAERIDKQVAADVNRNKDELYRVNPWLRPGASTEDTPWYEDAWNWLCDKGEQIADGLKKAWDWTKDTAKKAWKWAKDFYSEHKKIIDTVLIVVGAIAAIAAVVFSGGWALVPLLINVFAIPASAAITISTAVAVAAVVTTGLAAVLNVIDIWAEIDNPIFNTAQKVMNISSTLLNITYSIGNLYNSFKGYRITNFEGKKVIQNDGAYDLTPENVNRIQKGKPPIGKDGKAVELHHIRQTEDGGFIELTMKDHRGAGNYDFWHTTDPNFRSVVDHGTQWNAFKKHYWNWRGSVDFNRFSVNIRNLSVFNTGFAIGELFTNLFCES